MYILISIFLAYAAGIIFYEIGIFGYYFIVIFAVLFYNSIINRKFIYNAVIIMFVILSYINCHYNSNSILSQYINENVLVEARIKKVNKAESSSYHASIISINNKYINSEENAILYGYKNDSIDENSIVKVKVNVADNQLSRNRMLFNYKNYLRSKKISASLFATEKAEIVKENYSFFRKVALSFRDFTERTFYNNLNKKNADIILSIILGDVNYLDSEFYDNIKVMGLAHIFAVSGTHIVLIYMFLLSVFKFFLSRRTGWIIAWCLLWFYGFLIGFPLSVMRALVMFTLVFGSELLYRKYNSLNSIGLAALALTLYNPFWLFDAGFLLSFSAALSLIIFNNYIKSENTYFKNVYMYLFLQIFTLPVVVYYFNFLPVMGILYNLLLLPVFTVVMIYGFILLILSPFFSFILFIPFKIFDYILYSLGFIIDFSERVPFNGLVMPTLSICHTIFFYTAVFFMVYLYNNRTCWCKKYGIVAIVIFYTITYIVFPFMDKSLYFNVADAGQGVFTTLRYKRINMVFDCGSTTNKNMGKYTVVPYLTKRGINRIDALFISHWDEDHFSGLRDILSSNIKVDKVFSSKKNENFNNIEILNMGQKMEMDNLKMEILWPHKNIDWDDKNNLSLVVSIIYNDRRILLPGDIGKEAEYAIYNDLKHHDILVVPHHGSKTSSTEQFVEAVRPKYALLSYGRNYYGIPSEEVVYRYENVGSKVLSTFEQGEINFILKGDNLYYNTYTNEKSPNYYQLYFDGIIPKVLALCFLIMWMGREKYEL